MNFTNKSKVVVLLLAVVGLTVATNLATDYFKNSGKQQSFYNEAGFKVPASLANYTPGQGLVDFTTAAEKSVHAVVHVKTKSPVEQQQFGFNNPFFEHFFGRPQQPGQQQEAPLREGSGSGVIISTDGYIVTNNHVIEGSKEIEVTMNNNQTFKATLVGADKNTDIALLKIEAENLPVIPFGNSDDLKVGEWVLAVGNPFNLTSTVTAGIVSAKARNINILNAAMKIESFIQTDAAVNPGNSGGALVNTRGELVGINTAIASRTGSFAGYAFAVPTSIVQKVVTDMRKFGVVQRAVLGVRMTDITSELAKEKNIKSLNGAYVSEIVEGSAAQKAGIKADDVIINVNGVEIKTSAQLQEQIGRYSPGDKITVDVLRDNKVVKIKVELKNIQGNTAIVKSDINATDLLGARFKELTDKQKEKLGVENGIEVEAVNRGKLQQQGVRATFVIVRVNNQPINNTKGLERIIDETLNSNQSDKALFIAGVYPNGRVVYYAVNLAD
jgi:serine protease Do